MDISEPLIRELIGAAVREQASLLRTGGSTMQLGQYSKVSGVTPDAVRCRLAKGIWQMGVQVIDVPGVGRHVDLDAIDAWVRENSALVA